MLTITLGSNLAPSISSDSPYANCEVLLGWKEAHADWGMNPEQGKNG